MYFSQEGYFVVNGDGHLMPSVSPPLPVGRFSPPSIPGTPMQYGSPVWHPEWRPPSGSDNERSPIEAREGNIKIAEVEHIRMRIDEPIKVSILFFRLLNKLFYFAYISKAKIVWIVVFFLI